MRISDLANFIKARERHRVAKVRGGKVVRPDPIISQYRFCNVRRNDDRVTKEIHEWAFGPNQFHKNEFLWFALVVARLFNNKDTLLHIQDCVLPFKPAKMRRLLHWRRDNGRKNFNAAYIVSTNGRMMDKVDYVIDCILCPLWAERRRLSKLIWVGQLANAHIALMDQQGLGSFMAAQVLADLKYAPVPHVWEDFHTFAASGPGSRRGLNRLLGRPIKSPLPEAQFRTILGQLRDQINSRLSMEPLTAQDVQNCLCEFDKYERARLGEGKPKQIYKPAELPWKEG